MEDRKQLNVAPHVHQRVMAAVKRVKAPSPKAFTTRLITKALMDKELMAEMKEFYAK